MDRANEKTTSSLEHAIRCFDEAIALRSSLPLTENPFFRYGLSAGWINRGDALAQLGGGPLSDEAIKSYDEALKLLDSLPLEENVLYSRRLAITWINRGVALQKRELPRDQWEEVECFREAIGVLGLPVSAAVSDREALLAVAWANLAGSLTDSGEVEDARSAARESLVRAKFDERTDAATGQAALKARHALCRLAVRAILEKRSLGKALATEATDAVDEGISLALHWESQEAPGFAVMARDLFRFGCRIYAESQPHFLAEFVTKCLDAETRSRGIFSDHETVEAARTTIWGALDKLQVEGFQFVSTPRFEPFLSDVQQLRKVEERLGQLQTGPVG